MWWFIDQRVQPVMLRAKAIKSTNRMGRFSCLELFIDLDGKIFNLKKGPQKPSRHGITVKSAITFVTGAEIFRNVHFEKETNK
jgi:hypothetical protein